jgi:hypothetical protein
VVGGVLVADLPVEQVDEPLGGHGGSSALVSTGCAG